MEFNFYGVALMSFLRSPKYLDHFFENVLFLGFGLLIIYLIFVGRELPSALAFFLGGFLHYLLNKRQEELKGKQCEVE